MPLEPGQIEVISDDMARVLRAKTGAERLKIASGMFASARKLIQARVRSQHPDWTDEQINTETGRRLSHGAI